MTQTLRESIEAVERRRDAAEAAMTRIAREVAELAPGDPDIGRLHDDYCAQLRIFSEAAAEEVVRALANASEADFLETCHVLAKAASIADKADGVDTADDDDTVRLADEVHDLPSLSFAANVSARAAAVASDDEPSLEDAWSLLASRLLHVVDERIAALRVELLDEMDARIAIPDHVDKPGE